MKRENGRMDESNAFPQQEFMQQKAKIKQGKTVIAAV